MGGGWWVIGLPIILLLTTHVKDALGADHCIYLEPFITPKKKKKFRTKTKLLISLLYQYLGTNSCATKNIVQVIVRNIKRSKNKENLEDGMG